MKPGRELDALVAEKVMGWRRPDPDRMCQPWYTREDVDEHSPYGLPVSLPYFSLTIAEAWQVVEKLDLFRARVDRQGLDTGYCLSRALDGFWEIHYRHGIAIARESTAPHAICLAALKAVEAKVTAPVQRVESHPEKAE